jgi:hypothetical protein
MGDDQDTDRHPEQEAQRRFEELLRAALNTPPKQKKDIPRKRPYRPRKRKPAEPKARKAS